MACVYMTTPDRALLRELIDDLVENGLPAGQIRVFATANGAPDDLPVKTLRYRSPASNILLGAMVGGAAGLLLGLPLLLFGQFGLAPLLVVIVALGVGGALSRLWLGYGSSLQLYRMDEMLHRGEAVIVVSVRTAGTGAIEKRVSERFPQVKVLGTDTQGSPPFL